MKKTALYSIVYLLAIIILLGVVIWNAPKIQNEFNNADDQIMGNQKEIQHQPPETEEEISPKP